jgi:D-glycero-D-manno-heptose 1,7-bisphosphate phosphatase
MCDYRVSGALCRLVMFANVTFVFLDREGVLNRKPPEGSYITRWGQFEVLPGVEQAIARLNRSGRKVILVTNQRGVALGHMTLADLDALHHHLRDHLAQHGAHLDAIYACPHDVGQCHCRKPNVGLFEQAFADFPDARPEYSVMIGDSLSDIEAATRIGMASIFVAGDPACRKPGAERAAHLATATAASLPDCVERYLATGNCFTPPPP